jgi:transcriptional regulator with XRE-family HTH domain
MTITIAESLEERRREAGQWLKSQRLRAGHDSQKHFAGMLDIHQNQLNRIENGESGISAETLDRAIALLELDALEAYERFGMLPPSVRASMENERKAQARRNAEMIESFSLLPPDAQAQALALIRNWPQAPSSDKSQSERHHGFAQEQPPQKGGKR